jgi:hypothetical protein
MNTINEQTCKECVSMVEANAVETKIKTKKTITCSTCGVIGHNKSNKKFHPIVEEKHCECFNCEGWHEDYPEEGTVKVCEDASCGKEFSIYDPHYYDDHQCLCYCSKACYKNDENESDDESESEFNVNL